MEQKGTDDFLKHLRAEETDAAAALPEPARPEETTFPTWCGTYWRAWQVLRFDRPYGALGGEGPIPFMAIDGYARRYGIAGGDFEILATLIAAMDDEYLAWAGEKAKRERANADQNSH